EELALGAVVNVGGRAALVALGELLPGAEGRGEPLDLAAGLAVLGVELEGRARRLEGAELVVALGLPEAGRLAEDGDLLVGVLGEAEALLVEADELAPVFGALVEGPEDLDDAGLVLVVAGEALELLDRAHGVAEALAEEPRQREAVGRGLLAVPRRLGPAEVEIREVPIPTELAVELGQGVERAGVGVADVERGAVGLDSLLGLLELDPLEPGD